VFVTEAFVRDNTTDILAVDVVRGARIRKLPSNDCRTLRVGDVNQLPRLAPEGVARGVAHFAPHTNRRAVGQTLANDVNMILALTLHALELRLDDVQVMPKLVAFQ
jgi:hypothetical protein